MPKATNTATKKKTEIKKIAVKKAGTVKSVVKKTREIKTKQVEKVALAKNASVKKAPVKKIAKNPVLDLIVDAMREKKAQQVVSLNFSTVEVAICDYFVICNADSATQVNAIADNVEEQMFKKTKQWPIRCQGRENGFWIIIDYGDFIVHIFQTDYRRFYRLEELWADAKTTWYNEE